MYRKKPINLTKDELKKEIESIIIELSELESVEYYDIDFFKNLLNEPFDKVRRKKFKEFQEKLPLLERKSFLEREKKVLINIYNSKISEIENSHREIPTQGFKMWNYGNKSK